jgi:hypothetical protein
MTNCCAYAPGYCRFKKAENSVPSPPYDSIPPSLVVYALQQPHTQESPHQGVGFPSLIFYY